MCGLTHKFIVLNYKENTRINNDLAHFSRLYLALSGLMRNLQMKIYFLASWNSRLAISVEIPLNDGWNSDGPLPINHEEFNFYGKAFHLSQSANVVQWKKNVTNETRHRKRPPLVPEKSRGGLIPRNALAESWVKKGTGQILVDVSTNDKFENESR